ncbi:hypothetical protein ABID81_001861 [Frigoribacterium sp. PvP054]|uniref:TIM-barrel domain-containing protein n=1 Tax=Frigoribacterium sp. PvP054 TaxID=3156438 RepID=UPI0033915371
MRPTAANRTRRSRLLATALAALTAVGAIGFAAVPAQADDAAGRAVVSGEARFEVLSPTLIRTEYAGDGRFTDRGTFTVVGRDDFGPTLFSQTRADGWLTIDTGKMVVRYREGTGAFTSENLSVALTTDTGQDVTGSPWTSAEVPSCAVGVLCEAEDAGLEGIAPATNHTGFTGTAFVGGYEAVGAALQFDTTVSTAGPLDLTLRYANSQGGDGQVTTRSLSVVVDDGPAVPLSFAPGTGWDDWRTTTAGLDLSAGPHSIRIERGADDSGQVNVDSFALTAPGAAYPAPAATTAGADCPFGEICEAEDAGKTGTATRATDHNGASGDAFAAGLWSDGAALTTHLVDVPAEGDYRLQVRYANGGTGTPTLSTDAGTDTAALPPTSGWDHWDTVSLPVHLGAGATDVRLDCPTTAGNCNVNVDTVAAVTADSPTLAPHAALGGYRRDLDTANGDVATNPGLLYQDGWSLLDDTDSALYDQAADVVTPRPDRAGTAMQDGYVFGYGSDYRTGLADLSTLTGPTKLLPRWAYGVWYSEYYDRSQADYEAIAQEFRTRGVPVDVMAIDTDYKIGSTTNVDDSKWDGWSVDPARIPDMRALLAEWHDEGIHNTLNIHPSISGSDPKFAQAQATAGGKLTKGDGDRWLFDWSDPDQLRAYFDLHDDTQAQGVDNWWLDWCCSENSRYSANGVTPDAFINQQYAAQTDAANDGRGFAFSRAYGSLTAGGYGNPQPVSTGPWADKRTTLHFTGDTTSSWEMLKTQVGYTPGESAATGLASISHDIGGHNGAQYGITGAEPGTTQLPEDLYARWVQLGAFQPVDRLHSNHSDRLPWQYPAAADESATQFLNLREDLLPLTYTLAAEATATGTPIVQPLYLQYADQQEAYSAAGSEYLYGPDVLVAPVTTPNGDAGTATTSVWFPAGSSWTDWFTGTTYAGGTTADVTTDLTAMPVFVRGGGIVPTRSEHVANDGSAPLDAVTLTVATGADGAFSLYEDAGTSATASASTAVTYTQRPTGGLLEIAPADGSFDGQVTDRTWTATFTDADEPASVLVDGAPLAATDWTYDAATRTVSVPTTTRAVSAGTTVEFSSVAAVDPTPAPTPGDGATPSAPPTATVPGAGDGGTGGGDGTTPAADRPTDPSSGGPLAFTGADVVPLGLVALGLVLAGGLLLWRRRRPAE